MNSDLFEGRAALELGEASRCVAQVARIAGRRAKDGEREFLTAVAEALEMGGLSDRLDRMSRLMRRWRMKRPGRIVCAGAAGLVGRGA